MGREDEEAVEFVDGEPDGPAPAEVLDGRAPRWLPRWLPFVAAILLVGGGATYALTRGEGRTPAAAPSTRHTSPSAPPATVPPGTDSGEIVSGPTVIDAFHPLLGGGSWELFGLGSGVVVRIQPDAGRVTTTPLPAITSGDPVSLVATDRGVIVRPIDFVAGYDVPDGGAATDLSAPFNRGPVFPGPDGRHVWVPAEDDSGPPALVLLAADANLSGTPQRITLPVDASPLDAIPDGAGYVIIPGIDGAYDATPDGLRRITTGSVLAAGQSGWLVAECDERYRCALYRVDRANWSRQQVPFSVTPDSLDLRQRGVLSPDGTTAAVFAASVVGPGFRLLLINLDTGDTIGVILPGGASLEPGGLAWSPDGRRLLVLHGRGELAAVDPATGGYQDLGVPLPPLTQLSVRAAR